jgi:hypothetical protein
MSRSGCIRLVALVTAGCAVATPAHAGTVSVEPHAETGGKVLTFVAGAGEINAVYPFVETQAVSISDGVGGTGNAMQPLAPCVPAQSAFSASCPRAGIDLIGADLGDLEDSFGGMIYVLPVVVFGGAGGDNLTGGSMDDVLVGEAGADILTGGPGDDLLDGGPGPDRLVGDFLGASSPANGGGDAADYSERSAAVFVALDTRAADGELGEGDYVTPDVEDVYGGSGGDALYGSAAGNLIDGGAGDDTIDAGAGSDALVGGAGADTLRARDGEADYVDCGPGPDVAVVDAVDSVAADCEEVDLPALAASPSPTPTPVMIASPAPAPPPVAAADQTPATITVPAARRPTVRSILRGGLNVRLTCSEACLVTGELRISRALARSLGLRSPQASVVIGRGTGARLTAGAVSLTLTLTDRARRALRRLRSGEMTVRLTAIDAADNRSSTSFKVRPR